eukprot:CAMPEP_0113308756 /NCGR_PEP_ID=MMETSP0010_2-20120614/7079_1 /TAXON_ID=216773 ORGANISM="Corethron hystrix, Strain 308" /NCGR_SAMPLE_ID=MMETSP0010_2 /ASSEMBLY_ACC=CAM_ASM_000155 /LENGTH=640 /DNA_ID=CAMNT_0000163885 /DNA_START=148 /DNA_END=2070 /DNA_ORIENTATION=- /assembly_acc=CAM_ASM_000155
MSSSEEDTPSSSVSPPVSSSTKGHVYSPEHRRYNRREYSRSSRGLPSLASTAATQRLIYVISAIVLTLFFLGNVAIHTSLVAVQEGQNQRALLKTFGWKEEFRIIQQQAAGALRKVGDAVQGRRRKNGEGARTVSPAAVDDDELTLEKGGGKSAEEKNLTAKKLKAAKKRLAAMKKLAGKKTSPEHNESNKKSYLDPAEVPRDNRSFFPSVADENFESIVHPADPTLRVDVPHFWSPDPKTERWHPAGSLLTRTEAETAFGQRSPWGDPTIFVAIASYRDWQCRYTVESIYGRAAYPERIRVGVVDQTAEGDDVCSTPIRPCEEDPNQALCKFSDRIDVAHIAADLAIGPVFARHVGHRLYRGEYFAMQVDAHVTFVQDWDVDLIGQWKATGNEMAVLSTYLTDVQGSIEETTGRSLRKTRPIMCNTDFEGGQNKYLRHKSQPEGMPGIHGSPQLEPYWAAGFSFSRGHFVTNVKYDQHLPMIFQGEEISITVRGWTNGYDFYAFERSPCFHMYAVGANAEKRHKVKLFWENGSKYNHAERPAMRRLLGIIGMKPELKETEYDTQDMDIYGLGTHRTKEQFYQIIGIDVVHKVTEQHLCRFVDSGRMHNMFTPKMRKDGMGIDYEGVDFHFIDPQKRQHF